MADKKTHAQKKGSYSYAQKKGSKYYAQKKSNNAQKKHLAELQDEDYESNDEYDFNEDSE